MYAAPAWWGFLSMAKKDRLQAVIRKSQRYGFLYLATIKVFVMLFLLLLLRGNRQTPCSNMGYHADGMLNPWNLIYLDLFVQIPTCFVSPSPT